jgi:hypothetical protein
LLSLDLVAGRPFGGGDTLWSCRVALVNEAAAAAYFDGAPIGRTIADSNRRRVDIIGLVRPKRSEDVAAHAPRLYFYERQSLAAPTSAAAATRFAIGVPRAEPGTIDTDVDINIVSNGYFAAVGATVIAGRVFAADADACDTAVVNREAAQAYFRGDGVGGAVIDPEGHRSRIAGVVDDGALRVMQRRPAPAVYFPMAQRYASRMTMIAGSKTADPALVAEVGRRLREVPGGRTIPIAMTLDEHLTRTSLGPERVAAALIASSAGVVLVLSILGAYGVLSDAVRQRKREMALRLALGAGASKIISAVLRDSVRIAVAGAAAGIVASWTLVRAASYVDAGFGAPAAWMWGVSLAVLFAVVLAASVLPVRWALAVDPLTITRDS